MICVIDCVLSIVEMYVFGEEFDVICDCVIGSFGVFDICYICCVVVVVCWFGVGGCGLLFLVVFLLLFWMLLLWLVVIIGMLLLVLLKILENMELGYNVMYGQFDWIGDFKFNGNIYEWDIVVIVDNWCKIYNFCYYIYINVCGMDDDIGYGLLCIFLEQCWKLFYLLQLIIVLIFVLLFQWGVVVQDFCFGCWLKGCMSVCVMWLQICLVVCKMLCQVLKDYVFFLLLVGLFFFIVMLGNLVVNGLCNIWIYVIIFCGYFIVELEIFFKECLCNELCGYWYLCQLCGLFNISGGFLINVLLGNFSYQIEYYFYLDLLVNCYVVIVKEVKDICCCYGQYYNNGLLLCQFGQVVWCILCYVFLSKLCCLLMLDIMFVLVLVNVG